MNTPPSQRKTVQSYYLLYTCKYNRLTSVPPRYIQSAGSLQQAGGCAWNSSTVYVIFIILPIRNLPGRRDRLLYSSVAIWYSSYNPNPTCSPSRSALRDPFGILLQSKIYLLVIKTGFYTLLQPFGILTKKKIYPLVFQDRLLYLYPAAASKCAAACSTCTVTAY